MSRRASRRDSGSGAPMASQSMLPVCSTGATSVVRSTVGAGDSSLSGYLIAQERGDAAPECLRQAVASGSAAAALPGTRVPTLSETTPEAVTVRELPARAVSG